MHVLDMKTVNKILPFSKDLETNKKTTLSSA